MQKSPNTTIKEHEIYKTYQNKKLSWTKILDLEQEKIFYFILAYPQRIVLVKTGDKKAEKQFLGYEFSNRRGSEGIHPIQRGKLIDDCTQLYDPTIFDNPTKASTYIYRAFTENRFDLDILEKLQNNVSYQNLTDMLTFDRVDFEKRISLSIKKIEIKSKWEIVKIGDLIEVLDNQRIPVSQNERRNGKFPYYGATGIVDYIDKYIFDETLVLIGEDGAKWSENENSAFLVSGKFWVNNHAHVLRPNKAKLLDKYLIELLNQLDLSEYITGMNVPKLNQENLKEIKIPLPPKEVQEKIVAEIEVLEKEESEAIEKINDYKKDIEELFSNPVSNANNSYRLSDASIFEVSIGARVLRSELKEKGKYPVFSANVFKPFGFVDTLLITDFSVPSLLWGIDGDWMVNFIPKDKPFYPTDHCGFLRVKNKKVNLRFLAHILDLKGEELEFSRNNRASINSIKGIKIKAPSFNEQNKIVSQIDKTETKINQLEIEISTIPKQKEQILKKYL